MSKLPENAKLVFKGKIFDTYQWDQEMFDGSIKVFEKLRRNDSVDVIAISDNGEIYILEEQQPGRDTFYGLIGGTCEVGEDPLFTAKRELLEETGLSSDDWQLFNSYSISSKIDFKSNVFIARSCKKIQEQNLDGDGEKIKIRTVERKEFLSILANPKFRVSEFALEALRYIFQGREEELKSILFKGK